MGNMRYMQEKAVDIGKLLLSANSGWQHPHKIYRELIDKQVKDECKKICLKKAVRIYGESVNRRVQDGSQ